MQLYLIRHGQTDFNAQHRVQGWSDIPLNATGQAQAQALPAIIAAKNITADAIFASDLIRAQQTAAPTARALGLPVICTWLLRERHFGQYEGSDGALMPWDALNARPEQAILEGVEKQINVDQRAINFLSSLRLFPTPLKHVLIFSHGGMLNHFCSLLQPGHEFCEYDNGEIVTLDWDETQLPQLKTNA